eukprot:m.207760 g.207760  ORF g.207760 m.207760 type:complete len:382 (-) comp18940_c0_seq1:250-1395(-)
MASVTERLVDLQNALQRKLINQDEFTASRNAILASMSTTTPQAPPSVAPPILRAQGVIQAQPHKNKGCCSCSCVTHFLYFNLAVTVLVMATFSIVAQVAVVWISCPDNFGMTYCDENDYYCGQEYWVVTQDSITWNNGSCASRACDYNPDKTMTVDWSVVQWGGYVGFPNSIANRHDPSGSNDDYSNENLDSTSYIFTESVGHVFTQFGLAATALGLSILLFLLLNISICRLFCIKNPKRESKRLTYCISLLYFATFVLSMAGFLVLMDAKVTMENQWLRYFPEECTLSMYSNYEVFQALTFGFAITMFLFTLARGMALPRFSDQSYGIHVEAEVPSMATDTTPLFGQAGSVNNHLPPSYSSTTAASSASATAASSACGIA